MRTRRRKRRRKRRKRKTRRRRRRRRTTCNFPVPAVYFIPFAGSHSTDDALYLGYVSRFRSIYGNGDGDGDGVGVGVAHVYLCGDNDVGGESIFDPVTREKVERFRWHFFDRRAGEEDPGAVAGADIRGGLEKNFFFLQKTLFILVHVHYL